MAEQEEDKVKIIVRNLRLKEMQKGQKKEMLT